jgi:hypothetical protein
MISLMDHAFSVEMKSKQYIKNISISNESQDKVLFDGNLGKLHDMSLEEDRVLEFIGTNGVLRIAVTRLQLEKLLSKGNKTSSDEGGSENEN